MVVLTRADEIKQFLLANIATQPGNIVAYTSEHFGVTRTTVHRHLNTLIKEKKVFKFGTTRQIKYTLASARKRQYEFAVTAQLDEFKIWQDQIDDWVEDLSPNIQKILVYGFTEMLNNVIEHAQATRVVLNLARENGNVRIVIEDNGVGVFAQLKEKFQFENYRESLLHLTKGKLTTDPKNHTGQGIFFTSRIFDHFDLKANGLIFHRDNTLTESDWSLATTSAQKGTEITLQITENSTRKLSDIFNDYTDEEFNFDRTELLVDLSQLAGDTLISRPQAKLLLAKLEPFKRATLDFSKVDTVGQGFADEVFRVYVSKHAGIKIDYVNANEDVEFMIKRAIKYTPPSYSR